MMMKSPCARAAAALVAILCFVAAPFARAQTETPVPGELKVKPGKETQSPAETATPGSKEEKDRDKDKGKEEEKEQPPSVTEHTLTVGGKTIRYRATAGYMVMRDYSEKKKPEESELTNEKTPSGCLGRGVKGFIASMKRTPWRGVFKNECNESSGSFEASAPTLWRAGQSGAQPLVG